MIASPTHQRALLDIADLDARISRAEATRKAPPQADQIAGLVAKRTSQTGELAALSGARDDVKTELSRVESDVQLAKSRIDRDKALLQKSTDPKSAVALENEISTLEARLSALDDAQLELWEKLEAAEGAVSEQEALITATNEEGARLSAEAKSVVEDAKNTEVQARKDREAIVTTLPADLVAAYDRIAVQTTGAALLTRGTCGGCRMVLNATDISEIRSAGADDVVYCPECGCILVRTEESGL